MNPGSMRALVLDRPGHFSLADVPRPEPGSRDVLVRPQAVGLCGTDFHIYSGEANYHRDEHGAPIPLEDVPQILGHEITGVIEAVGAEVDELRVGQRVVLDQGLNCNSHGRVPVCEYCSTGDSHQCEYFGEHGISGLHGGLSEALSLPAVNAIAIQSDLDPALAALTEPLACVLHSSDMVRDTPTRYRLETDDPARRARTVLICGAGPAGLLWVQVLRRVVGFQGDVLVSEPDPAKRVLAASYGAHVVDPVHDDLTLYLHEKTSGRRAEVLVDASGSGPLFLQIPGLVRKQATLLLYGHGHAGVGMEALNSVQWGEPHLLSPVGASGGFDPDGRPTVYRQALSLIEDGTIDVTPLVTHRFAGLDAVPAAFAGAHREEGYVKGVAVFP